MSVRPMRLKSRVIVACTAVFVCTPVVVNAAPVIAHAAPVAVQADEPDLEAQLLVIINASRAEAGLAPLQRNAVLDQAADEWSAYMVAGSCPPGRWPLCHRPRADWAVLAKAASAPHGYRWWAENVSYTFSGPAGGHAELMVSPAHRANLMRPTTNLIGIGMAYGPGGALFITEEFVEAKLPKIPPPAHPCGKMTKSYSYGSRSSQVKVLQCALAGMGFYAAAIDGKFGKVTKAAVLAYQTDRALKRTGKADLATRRALGVTT